MQRPRKKCERFVQTIVELDGVWHLVVARGVWGFTARRLTSAEFERAMKMLDDVHADIDATLRPRE
jgi:hypothetical protein